MTSLADPRRPAEHAVHLRFGAGEGWLVVDSRAGGLAFGGTRIHPDVTADEVRGLARAMTLKLAGHGLPTGGAKLGLRCTPAQLADPACVAAVADQLREALCTCAVLGKDMGATDALLDALYAALGRSQLHLVARRSPAGCPGRIRDLAGYVPHMTGRGAAWAACAALGGSLAGRRVAIQGAGVVGLGTAFRVAELGAVVVAVSDVAGMIACPDGGGFAVDDLLRCAAGDGRRIDRSRCDFPHVAGPREAIFATAADVLVLAASSHSVDETHAATIAAPWVVEASNFGLTEPARRALAARGRRVVPDVIASSASAALVCSQIAAGNSLAPDALWASIRGGIETSVRRALDDAGRDGDLRTAYIERIRRDGPSRPRGAEARAR